MNEKLKKEYENSRLVLSVINFVEYQILKIKRDYFNNNLSINDSCKDAISKIKEMINWLNDIDLEIIEYWISRKIFKI